MVTNRPVTNSFKEGFRWVFSVWYDRWFLWLSLFFAVELTNQILIAMLSGFEASQAAYILGGLLSSSLDFTLATMVPAVLIGVRKNQRVDLGSHLKKYFNQACIESIRSTARVAWFSFLLFVPGFIKLIRLQFVPYIVQFDEEYDKGKKDALLESERLSKGFFLRILFVFLTCSFIVLLEGVRTAFKWDSPYFALAFILTVPLRLYTQIVWFSFYEAVCLGRNLRQ